MTDKKSKTCYINKILTNYSPSTKCCYYNTLKNFCLSRIQRPRCLNFSIDFATGLKDRFHLSFSYKAELTTGENANKTPCVDDKDLSSSRMQKIIHLEKEVDTLKHLLRSNENNE